MNTVTIEQAALRNAIGRFDDDDEILDVSVQSFSDGVKWCVNVIWKNNLSECQTCKRLLVEFTNNNIAMYDDVRELKGIEDLVSRWAYLEDLLSYRKEGNK